MYWGVLILIFGVFLVFEGMLEVVFLGWGWLFFILLVIIGMDFFSLVVFVLVFVDLLFVNICSCFNKCKDIKFCF